MPAITSLHVAQAVLKLVAEDALPALIGTLVMGNLVNRNYEPVLAQAGDKVNAARTLRGDDAPDDVTLSHIEATFQVPDVTKVLAVPDLVRRYMEPAVEAIAEKIETDLLGLYNDFTANMPVGTAGTAITEPVVDAAETALANQLHYMIVDSDTYSVLEQLPRFRVVGRTGRIGKIKGRRKDFEVFRSQFVPKTEGNWGSLTTHNLAFGRDAIGLVIRRLPSPIPGTGVLVEYAELGNFGMRIMMSYQSHSLAQQFTLDVLYGAAVIHPEFGVQVLT